MVKITVREFAMELGVLEELEQVIIQEELQTRIKARKSERDKIAFEEYHKNCVDHATKFSNMCLDMSLHEFAFTFNDRYDHILPVIEKINIKHFNNLIYFL